jgi:hypothetical protein
MSKQCSEYFLDLSFNPLRTAVYFCHQNQKIKKNIAILDAIETLEHWYLLERYSDKLSCSPVIFKNFPLLGEFHHFL